MNKNLPFSVPQNYFEQFAAKMDMKIAQKTVHKRQNWWIYSVAAVFVGMLVVGQLFYSNYQQSLYTEDYETYVLSQVGNNAMYYYLDDID